MALRPSTAPLRVPLPSPPESSLLVLADPESDSLRAASPTVMRLLATVVTDPSFESTAASALVAELVEFAARCRLDYATSLVAESASVCPPSVGGECALSTDVLEDRQEEFQCFAAALPHLVSTLTAPEGDPDAPDIPTPRSYAEAIEGPYSSQWQPAMDAEMASWKSIGTYKQWRNLTLLWQEYKRGDGGSGHGSVEKPPWYSYMELHNQDTAATAPHAVDGGGATDVNVPAGMEVPSSSQPGMSTPTFTAPLPPTTATPRRARVHETATMQAAMLVSATIKECHGDSMMRIESLIREWMAQDMRLARERMTESAPPDVHRAPPDFSPPPPRGESAPPPKAAQHGDDVGDANTVTPGVEDVEIWVRGGGD
ncbi:unnamed protein product [Closterium sp. NIES-53]